MRMFGHGFFESTVSPPPFPALLQPYSRSQLLEVGTPDLAASVTGFMIHLKAAGRAPGSLRCYQGYLERLVAILNSKPLSGITADDLDQAIVTLRERYPCSAVTLNKIKSIFRGFFRWAWQSGRLVADPAAHLVLSRAVSLPTRAMSAAEVTVLLEVIRNSEDPLAARDELLFATYTFTGIRRSEAVSLRVRDYDRMLRALVLRDTKGGGSRVQPVPTRLAELMERHIDRMGSAAETALFTGRRRDNCLSARQVQYRFDYWKRRSGIRVHLTLHSFRAGFATRLYHDTGDLWLVARALGHVSVHATRRYVEFDERNLYEAVERVFL
jgi:site-specific recombinase XerD